MQPNGPRDTRPTDGERGRSPLHPSGTPWALVLPLATLAAVLVAATAFLPSPSRGERRRLEAGADPGGEVPDDALVRAFGHTWELPDGSALTCRLTPVHADDELQRAEALTLGRRYELPTGELWRLELLRPPTAQAPDTREPPDRAAQSPQPPVAEAQLIEVDAEGLVVFDADGLALEGLGALLAARAGVPPSADPLRFVLGRRRGELLPGGRLDFLLWGRPPTRDARLVGLGALEPGPSEVALEQLALECAELPRFLARLAAPDASDSSQLSSGSGDE